MRSTFSLGALALLLSGSALVPAIAESSLAATSSDAVAMAVSSPEPQGPTPAVAIREVDVELSPSDAQIKQAPPTRIAPDPKPEPSGAQLQG